MGSIPALCFKFPSTFCDSLWLGRSGELETSPLCPSINEPQALTRSPRPYHVVLLLQLVFLRISTLYLTLPLVLHSPRCPGLLLDPASEVGGPRLLPNLFEWGGLNHVVMSPPAALADVLLAAVTSPVSSTRCLQSSLPRMQPVSKASPPSPACRTKLRMC